MPSAYLHLTFLPHEILDRIVDFLEPCTTTITSPAAPPRNTHPLVPLSRTCKSLYRFLLPRIYRPVVFIPTNVPIIYRLSLFLHTILEDRSNVTEYMRFLEIRIRHRKEEEQQQQGNVNSWYTIRGLWKETELELLRRTLTDEDANGGFHLAKHMASWGIIESVLVGEPDVLLGVIIGLLGKRGTGGLRKLKLPSTTWWPASPPSGFIWSSLTQILPTSSFTCPSSGTSVPFSSLTTVHISATRGYPHKPILYEPSMERIISSLLRLPALTHLSLFVLERTAFRLIPFPLDLPEFRNLTVTHLTLCTNQPESLHAVLTLIPNLTTLDGAFLVVKSLPDPRCRLYDTLGAALQLVKGTLRGLSVCFWPWQSIHPGQITYEIYSYFIGRYDFEVWFEGDPLVLKLQEYGVLKKLTISLGVLLGQGLGGGGGEGGEGRGGRGGGGGSILAERLLDSLEELWLSGDCSAWASMPQWDSEIEWRVKLVEDCIRRKGVGTRKGCLTRVVVLREQHAPRPCPIERQVLGECGVEVVFAVESRWRREGQGETFL